MARKASKTIGAELEDQLLQAIKKAQQAPRPGARDLPCLRGLCRRGASFTLPQENVLLEATDYLVQSKKLFLHGNAVVLELDGLDGKGKTLQPLRTGAGVETGAEDH